MGEPHLEANTDEVYSPVAVDELYLQTIGDEMYIQAMKNEMHLEGNIYSCPHVEVLPAALRAYNHVLGRYVTCIAENEPFKRKAIEAYCRVCNSAQKKLHACLQCAFFGCFQSENGKVSHMKRHALKYKHYFAINLNHGALFCFQCDDYMYNERFENSLTKFEKEARRMKITQADMPWKPSSRERMLLRDKIVNIVSDPSFSLRQ